MNHYKGRGSKIPHRCLLAARGGTEVDPRDGYVWCNMRMYYVKQDGNGLCKRCKLFKLRQKNGVRIYVKKWSTP